MRDVGGKGGVLIETTLLIAVLVVMFMGLVDLGRWYGDYVSVKRMTYEAARMAARYPGLFPGMPLERYQDIVRRVHTLSTNQGFGIPQNVTVTVLDPAPRRVRVEVIVNFQPFFGVLRVRQVRARQDAQYMFT